MWLTHPCCVQLLGTSRLPPAWLGGQEGQEGGHSGQAGEVGGGRGPGGRLFLPGGLPRWPSPREEAVVEHGAAWDPR